MSAEDASAVSQTQGPEGLVLSVAEPNGEMRQIRVDRSPYVIGRLPDCDLSLRDTRISRRHAQILLENGSYYVEDCNSRHGLFVNGRKLARAPLKEGDSLDFGVTDSYRVLIGRPRSYTAPLLKKVAQMSEGTGDLGRLRAVIDVARALESSGNVNDVLAAAVDAALSLTRAERGFLLLKQEDGVLKTRLARDSSGADLAGGDLLVPLQAIAEALLSRSELFAMSFDPNVDPNANDGGVAALAALESRGVICVPLLRIRLGQAQETSMLSASRDTIGVLYMDSRKQGADLAGGNRELLQTLAIEISSVLENARLLDEERKKHGIERELQIAREMQQAMLPASLPTAGWLTAAGSSQACFQVGGDYYDVAQLPGERWSAVLADVSGKGVSAALLSSMLQGAFFFSAASDGESLGERVGRINRYVCERSRNARFATAFTCMISRHGTMRWVNAGHCPALLLRADESTEWLKPASVPIGLFIDAEFPTQETTLAPGDRLIVYSDGVSEASSYSRERFGEKRLAEAATAQPGLSALELYAHLLEELAAFTEGSEQDDDITLLTLGYQGS